MKRIDRRLQITITAASFSCGIQNPGNQNMESGGTTAQATSHGAETSIARLRHFLTACVRWWRCVNKPATEDSHSLFAFTHLQT